jgi:predicted metal-dependent phosphoesterase TrpH
LLIAAKFSCDYIHKVNQPDIFTIPFLALYAETHFRFSRLIPSFLFRQFPEIIFDVPQRIDPDSDLPVLLLFNDIINYPIECYEIAVVVSQNKTSPQLFTFPNAEKSIISHPLENSQKAYLFWVPRKSLQKKEVFINAKVTIKKGRHIETIVNDNFITTSKAAFKCYIADEYLPGSKFCSYSDLHIHSNYSQSHVEFGPPIEAIVRIAKASGLHAVAITDHSYDLECDINDYLKKDQNLNRYNLFLSEIEKYRNEKNVIVIPGEEISCLNSKGKVIHLCGLGTNHFIPGSLDGARRFAKNEKQLQLSEVIDEIHGQSGFAFAAHAGARTKLLQSILLHRGDWSEIDTRSGIDAVQGANGDFEGMWERGKMLWIKLIQNNCRIPLIAGNDAHGDFNRYRAIQIPFIKIRESFDRFLGYVKTGVYGKPENTSEYIDLIRGGKTFVTNGPFLTISSSKSPDTCCVSHTTTADRPLYIIALCTNEFGYIKNVFLWGTKEFQNTEVLLYSKRYEDGIYSVAEELPLDVIKECKYIRAEVRIAKDKNYSGFAATSACFLRD